MFLTAAGSRTWLTEADCDLDDFRALVEQATDPREHPRANYARLNVPLYDSDRLRVLAAAAGSRCQVRAGIDAEAARRCPEYGAIAVGGASPLVADAVGGGDPARMRKPACDCLKVVAEVPR